MTGPAGPRSEADAATLEDRLPAALLVLRATLGVFMLLWAVEKFVRPGTSAQIWESFYGIGLPAGLSPWLGAAELLLVAAFLAGAWRRWSYGLVLLINLASIGSTWPQLLSPYEGSNHLFLAGIPVLGAFVALYLLREWDVYSWDAKRRGRPPEAGTAP